MMEREGNGSKRDKKEGRKEKFSTLGKIMQGKGRIYERVGHIEAGLDIIRLIAGVMCLVE